MAAADSAKILLELSRIQREDIRIQGDRINNLIERDSLRTNIINNQEKQISVMGEQRKLYDAELSSVTKLLKKEKRKRWWTAVAGIVAASGAFWLGLNL